MAIAFARPEYVGRSGNKNACCKSSYNSRSRVVEQNTGKIYNFTNHGGNAYHEMLLPEYVDKEFQNIEKFSNEVERAEKRKDSQLYVEWLLALPKEKEITLEMKKEIIGEFIERKGWVKEGLGVQIDIHEPHVGDVNWHAHLLVTTRRFRKDGLGLEAKKAVDLQPEVKFGRVQKTAEIDNHKFYEKVLNDKFKEWGLDLRVDLPGEITQEHVGPIRMRSIFNEAVQRNEERREAEIELLHSGSRVIEKVTKHMSVFTKADLTRAVKCIPSADERDRLVKEAMSDEVLVSLYREEGQKTQYFTTKEVRKEENKIVRLSKYLANEKNVFWGGRKITQLAINLVEKARSNLSDEQHQALKNIVFDSSGLRILRGRAGTGKSYVLGKLNNIATCSGINVIGIAPTHKAKLGLSACGYENVDTVKGMLFKLANGRFDLPKYSLVVVDEAGMIGNDDYKELLRVLATRKCNVILSGDERQLASVQRGGMFEVFANRYGSSTIFDIQRQESSWGKSVAMSMSTGHVESAMLVLENENRIKWSKGAASSMESLLQDWNSSEGEIGEKLILAVANKDVAALNHGARQYLKLAGKLTGEEIAVAGNHYMKGDRIVITKTNNELGLVNGDLVDLVHASKDKFILRMIEGNKESDNKAVENKKNKNENKSKIISFNPSEYYGFRHGYATTIFKSQGASIKDVYMFHNGFAGIRNSYVALSRHKVDLNLYVNSKSTSNKNSLIRQLSHDAEAASSLVYFTNSELKDKEVNDRLVNDKSMFVRGVNNLIDFVGNGATKLVDKHIPSFEYYNYKKPEKKYEQVSTVIDRTYEELEKQDIQNTINEEKIVVGGNNHNISKNSINNTANNTLHSVNGLNDSISVDSRVNSSNLPNSSASAVIANINSANKTENKINATRSYEAQKEAWIRENDYLNQELRFKVEYIVRDLLGAPNKKLSNGRELRYGDHGKLAVRITGEKAGTWYDFSTGEGGNLVHLAQNIRGGDFKDVIGYLKSAVGMNPSSSVRANLKLVNGHREKDRLELQAKERKEQEKLKKANMEYVSKLHARSKDINEKSVAYRYLSKVRGINIDLIELSPDMKTAGIYDREKKLYMPALIAYAKDRSGNITGGQYILLDKKTNNKANVGIPKKSFGKISGSFIDLGNVGGGASIDSKKPDITIIAEGIETGLSIKQALSEHKQSDEKNIIINIQCSLGISNIKNYEAIQCKKIIIAADNDGKDSITNKTIENTKSTLESKGISVEIVKPQKEGDFNDVLMNDENKNNYGGKDSSNINNGSREISNILQPAIERHRANNLSEYLASSHSTLNDEDKANLSIVEKYNFNQEKIINAWRINPDHGREELKAISLEVSIIEKSIEANSNILDLAKDYDLSIDKSSLVSSMLTSSKSAEQNCIDHLLSDFAKQKQEANQIGDVFNIIKKEDKFLSNVNIQDKKALDSKLQDRLDLSKTGQNKDIIANIKKSIEANDKQGIINHDDLLKKIIASGYDIKSLDVVLNQLVVNGRSKLRLMEFDLSQLSKLNYKYDIDKLVNDVKSMSDQEKVDYSNKLLAEHGNKYFNSVLHPHLKEKASANNFTEFMKAIGSEQKTLLDLYNNHKFAAQAIDRHGMSKYKMLVLTSSAHKINSIGGMDKVMKTFNYAFKHKITDQNHIMSELKRTGGNLEQLHDIFGVKCKNHFNTQLKMQKTQEELPKKEKQKEIKIDKGFSM